jgi:fibronectin-binding autotransporter adhesin
VRSFRSLARRARLSVQPLEGRDTPDGTIAAVLSGTGVLTLTGDDFANDVQIRIDTTVPNVTLTSTAGTTITAPTGSGASVTLPGVVKSIKANLLGGADDLSIDPAAAFNVPGLVTLGMGDGDNVVNLSTSAAITLLGLTVTGGDGFDNVTVQGGATSTIGGNVKFTYADGGSTTTLTGTGATTAKLVFTGGVTVSAGDAATFPNINSVSGTNVQVAKTFSAALGNSFPAALDFTDSTLGGLKASGQSVGSVLTDTTINGSISYKTGYSADIRGDGLTVTKNVALTAPNASLEGDAGKIEIDGNLAVSGTAATSVSFQTTVLSEVKGTITVKGGWYNDTFETNATFKADKNVSLTLNGGDNVVTIGDGTTAVTFGGTLSVKAGGGTDQVTLDKVIVAGAVTMTLGAGNDLLSIEDGATFNNLFTADLGTGDDTISIAQNTGSTADVTFAKKTKILAGAGNDTLFLGLANDIVVGGDAHTKVVFTDPTSVVDGGTGVNDFDPTTAQFSPTTVAVNW